MNSQQAGPAGALKKPRSPRRKLIARSAAPGCNFLTVEQFAERWTAWTPASLRALIYESRDRMTSQGKRITGNGLAKSGALIRLGRRVLLDEQAFFAWLKNRETRT